MIAFISSIISVWYVLRRCLLFPPLHHSLLFSSFFKTIIRTREKVFPPSKKSLVLINASESDGERNKNVFSADRYTDRQTDRPTDRFVYFTLGFDPFFTLVPFLLKIPDSVLLLLILDRERKAG